MWASLRDYNSLHETARGKPFQDGGQFYIEQTFKHPIFGWKFGFKTGPANSIEELEEIRWSHWKKHFHGVEQVQLQDKSAEAEMNVGSWDDLEMAES